MPDTTTETPETPKTKKRRTLRRISGSSPGWEEREKARLEREARIDKFLNLAQEMLEKLTTPPPSHSNYVAPAMPEFDAEFFNRQKIYQHNTEMRSMLKNYLTISTALNSDEPDWAKVDETLSRQFYEIDAKYPIYEVIDENGNPTGSI